MQSRIVLLGTLVIALGFILIALPLGTNQFSITCYVVVAGLVAAAAGNLIPKVQRATSLGGFGIAALACLNLVRLLIGAPLDLTVFLLIALGFAGVLPAIIHPNQTTRTSILLGAAGALTYLVHDLIVGYTGQLLADSALSVGFVVLWYGHKLAPHMNG